jgi:hypothetical protein
MKIWIKQLSSDLIEFESTFFFFSSEPADGRWISLSPKDSNPLVPDKQDQNYWTLTIINLIIRSCYRVSGHCILFQSPFSNRWWDPQDHSAQRQRRRIRQKNKGNFIPFFRFIFLTLHCIAFPDIFARYHFPPILSLLISTVSF